MHLLETLVGEKRLNVGKCEAGIVGWSESSFIEDDLLLVMVELSGFSRQDQEAESFEYYIDHKVLSEHHYDLLFDLWSPQIGF